MSPHVNGIVERGCKTLTTQHTQVGRLLDLVRTSRVDLDVRSKVVLPVELFLAMGAFEFLLGRIVYPIVPL